MSNNENLQKERRIEARIKISCPATIWIGPDKIECMVYDVSSHGICFMVDKRYFMYRMPRKGTELRYTIKDPLFTPKDGRAVKGHAYAMYAFNKCGSVMVGCISMSLAHSDYIKAKIKNLDQQNEEHRNM